MNNVNNKEDRKPLTEQKQHLPKKKQWTIWRAFGTLSQIGWSIVLPVVLGILIGMWADARWHSGISLTLIGMLIGTLFGTISAWFLAKKYTEK